MNLKLCHKLCLFVSLTLWTEVLHEDSMYDEEVQMGSVHLITQAELPAVTAKGSRIPISAEPNTHPIISILYLDI